LSFKRFASYKSASSSAHGKIPGPCRDYTVQSPSDGRQLGQLENMARAYEIFGGWQ